MHESPVHKIVAAAEQRARALGFSRISTVRVRLAAWSGIEPEELQREFAEESKNTAASGAELLVESIEPKCVCRDCGIEFEPDAFALRCTKCNSPRVVLQHTHELEVDIEL